MKQKKYQMINDNIIKYLKMIDRRTLMFLILNNIVTMNSLFLFHLIDNQKN